MRDQLWVGKMQVGELQGENGRTKGVRAVNEIIDHSLLATPQNYELWLHIQNDWTPALTADVQNCLKSGKTIDEQACEELYEKHLGNSHLDNAVVTTGARLAQELADALAMLKSAGHKTEAFSDNLDEAAAALETGRLNNQQIMGLVHSLSQATREMSKENAELTDRLENSSKEVEDLRSHLQKVRLESLTDMLTGLANRRMFDETLRMRMEEARNLGYPLGLAMCDIDFFKQFNDTWGHQTGDQVLRFVGSVLKSHSMDDQLVARFGGEEFAIILPRLTLKGSRILLDSMRRAVETKQLKRKSTNENLGHVTISIGVAVIEPNDTAPQLIQRADEMLYAAKRNGRNQVVTTEDTISLVA